MNGVFGRNGGNEHWRRRFRASGSCEAAMNVKSTAAAVSCVAPYVQWRSVYRGIFSTMSPDVVSCPRRHLVG